MAAGPRRRRRSRGAATICLVAADVETGEIVGFTWMHWWDEADGTRLYLLSGCVHPRRRRRGVGTALLRWQEEQATAFDRAESAAAASRAFGVNVAPHQAANLALLTAEDYRIAFTVVELTCDPHTHLDSGELAPLPGGLVLRHRRPVAPPLDPRGDRGVLRRRQGRPPVTHLPGIPARRAVMSSSGAWPGPATRSPRSSSTNSSETAR